MHLKKDYWNDKWHKGLTGWDIGYVSPPIREYIDQIKNKNLRILIPGSGNSYEGEYLFRQEFTNIRLLDFSPIPFSNLKKRCPGFPEKALLNEDFFLHSGEYDLILEQTFFSSLPPERRKDYAIKMHELLKPGGKLAGLLFNIELYSDRPPYGGSEKEYRDLFEPYFRILKLETAYNSIKPRKGNELFMILEKRK